MLRTLIQNTASPWTMGTGKDSDVVLCTRIRLTRNFVQYPFPLKQTEESGQAVLADLSAFCKDRNDLQFYDLSNVSSLEKRALVEKHYISPEHSKEDNHNRGIAVNTDGSISIMINEEDHLRVQCFAQGLDLDGLWQKANALDDDIESYFDYAFDEKLGYLTCCPSNLGNGMRASVMMHLPGLTLTKRLGILDQLSNFDMTVRGLFGEGSQSVGDLYQISNQSAIGQSEKDILTNLKSVTQQIIKEERNARNFLKEQNGLRLSDKIWRAYGTLCNARYMSSHEALELISLVRLGYHLGYFTQLKSAQVDQLYLMAQPGYLQVQYGNDMDETARDVYRAEKLRNTIKGDE